MAENTMHLHFKERTWSNGGGTDTYDLLLILALTISEDAMKAAKGENSSPIQVSGMFTNHSNEWPAPQDIPKGSIVALLSWGSPTAV